jgi:hypothetical protein
MPQASTIHLVAVRQRLQQLPRAQRSQRRQPPEYRATWYGVGRCISQPDRLCAVLHNGNVTSTAARRGVPAMQGPFGGAGGMPGMMGGGGMPGMMGMDPQQLQQMMNSPVVQNLLENPEFLRSMMQSNPALRQVQYS